MRDDELAPQEMKSTQPEPRDLSVNFDDVFGDNRTAEPADPTPPREDTWLLHSSNNSASNSDGRIPRIVNKIYFQKDGRFRDKLPPNAPSKDFLSHYSLVQAHRSWSSMNPGYNVRYFDLMSAREYLHNFFHPVFLRTFDCIQAFAGKSDFFRMALLYREGGFHTDWKMVCEEAELLDRIANSTDFFVAVDMGNPVAQLARRQSRACAANAFVGSVPGHPIVVRYLEIVMNHVQRSYYHQYSLYLTGPCAFGMAVRAIQKDFGSPKKESWPVHKSNRFYWRDKEIVLVKCEWCGATQNWADGNNYNKLAKNRTYYCEDSASIFQEPLS